MKMIKFVMMCGVVFSLIGCISKPEEQDTVLAREVSVASDPQLLEIGSQFMQALADSNYEQAKLHLAQEFVKKESFKGVFEQFCERLHKIGEMKEWKPLDVLSRPPFRSVVYSVTFGETRQVKSEDGTSEDVQVDTEILFVIVVADLNNKLSIMEFKPVY